MNDSDFNYKRIAIVGVSCSGKTTLGKKLSKNYGHNLIDIDEIYWKPGWVSTPVNEFIPMVQKEMNCDKWIVTGNYRSLKNLIWSKADLIIWLDYSFFKVLYRTFSRSIKRAFKKEIACNGNYETFKRTFFSKDSIILWVLKTYFLRKRQYKKEMQNPTFPNAKILQIKTDKELIEIMNSQREKDL